jgi:hypothetical protein
MAPTGRDELRPLEAGEQSGARADILFAGRRPGPARPTRGRRVLWLLALAVPLNLLGLVSCTLVPGTLLTLWAWIVVKRELAILEHGELPVQETLRLTRLDRLARAMLAACGVLLVAQAYLLTTGFYQNLLLRLDLWLGR